MVPAHRGGFRDLWEASNQLEWTSHAYEGDLYDLVVSHLEVHHQNDAGTHGPPREHAHRYPNPFIPQDLLALPGS
jgi:hypothetical protein